VTGITTHVLDLAHGRPVAGLAVRLERHDDPGGWRLIGVSATDGDGRVRDWPDSPEPRAGAHRLTFLTGPHFLAQGTEAFYPEVSVVFRVADAGRHHHVPLLLSPFGYTTYRGS
jgi:5-hydroxyisourate hydrolase